MSQVSSLFLYAWKKKKNVYGSKIRKPRKPRTFRQFRQVSYFFLPFFSPLPELFTECLQRGGPHSSQRSFTLRIIYDPHSAYTDPCTERYDKKKKLPATINAHSLSAHYVRDGKTLARRCRSRWWRRWLRCRCSRRSGNFLVAFPVAFSLPTLLHLAFSLALALLELQQHPRGTRRTDSSSVGGKDERWWRREGGRWILGDGMRGGRAAGHRRRLRCRQQISPDLKLRSLR